jgi:hypothetical protein
LHLSKDKNFLFMKEYLRRKESGKGRKTLSY